MTKNWSIQYSGFKRSNALDFKFYFESIINPWTRFVFISHCRVTEVASDWQLGKLYAAEPSLSRLHSAQSTRVSSLRELRECGKFGKSGICPCVSENTGACYWAERLLNRPAARPRIYRMGVVHDLRERSVMMRLSVAGTRWIWSRRALNLMFDHFARFPRRRESDGIRCCGFFPVAVSEGRDYFPSRWTDSGHGPGRAAQRNRSVWTRRIRAGGNVNVMHLLYQFHIDCD